MIEATTPEGAENAARALLTELSSRPDVFRTVSRAAGGEFFERNGILFENVPTRCSETPPIRFPRTALSECWPSIRRFEDFRTLSHSLEGVRIGKARLDDLRPALAAIADTLQADERGSPRASRGAR